MNRPPKPRHLLPTEAYDLTDEEYREQLQRDHTLGPEDRRLLLALKSFGPRGATNYDLARRANDHIANELALLQQRECN
jgi:hypothetical protein